MSNTDKKKIFSPEDFDKPKSICESTKPKRKIVTVLSIVLCAIVACVILWLVGGDNPNAASEKKIAEATQTVQENAPSSTLESENIGEPTESDGQTTEIADNSATDVLAQTTGNSETVQPTEPVVTGNTEPDIPENEAPVVETPAVQTAPVAESTPKINTSNNSDSVKLSEEYIEKMVLKVIRGNYGNGQERKDKLGDEYNEIQSKVNEYYRNNGLL